MNRCTRLRYASCSVRRVLVIIASDLSGSLPCEVDWTTRVAQRRPIVCDSCKVDRATAAVLVSRRIRIVHFATRLVCNNAAIRSRVYDRWVVRDVERREYLEPAEKDDQIQPNGRENTASYWMIGLSAGQLVM